MYVYLSKAAGIQTPAVCRLLLGGAVAAPLPGPTTQESTGLCMQMEGVASGASIQGALNSCSRNAFPAGVCHPFLDKFLELGRRVRCAWLVSSLHMFEAMAVNGAEGKKFKATE